MRTIARPLAVVAGTVATIGALAILLQDAIRTGVWTTEHALLPVLVVVTILSGHLCKTAIHARKLLSAGGFLVVATVATWGVIYTSVGKQSEVSDMWVKSASASNAERQRLLRERDKAQTNLDTERTLFARECASGKGKRCEGSKAAVDVYANALVEINAALQRTGPEMPVSPKAERMAEVLSVITNRDKEHIQHVLLLIEPFMYSLIFELCALVSFGFAFQHVPATEQVQILPPAWNRRGATQRDPKVVGWIMRYRDKYGRNPTIREVQTAYPTLPRSTAWDYARNG